MHAVNETTKPIRSNGTESIGIVLTLADVPVGGSARIVEISGTEEPYFRLSELGFVEGERVRVMKRAPLGDPIEIRIMHYDLCIRLADAAFVSVVLEESFQEEAMTGPGESKRGVNGAL
jgi:Fe2+ transport system protein FeoA